MKAGDYVKVIKAIKALEHGAYSKFDELWKKLYNNRENDFPLTDEEIHVMDYLLFAMQDLGYIRGILEAMGGEE